MRVNHQNNKLISRQVLCGLWFGIGFLVIAPSYARSTEPMTLDLLQQRHLKAIGGEEAIRALRSVYEVYDLDAGSMKGTVSTWAQIPFFTKTDIDLTVFKQSEGCDGALTWSVDVTGNLTTEPLAPEKLAVPREVLPSFSYLFKNPTLTIEFGGETTEHGVKEYILIATETGEEPQVMFIDAKTYLVNRMTTKEEGLGVTFEYTEYKPIAGIMVAHSIRQIMDLPLAPPLTSRLKELTWNPSLDVTMFNAPGNVAKKYEFGNGSAAENIPMTLHEGHIFLKVKVNGADTLDFLLDSGAGRTLLSTQAAERLGLELGSETESIGVGGAQKINQVALQSLELPGLTLVDQEIFAMDFSAFTPHLGRSIDGILGYDFFVRFVVKLDYAQALMSVYEAEGFEYAGSGEVISGVLEMNMMSVGCTVEDRYTGNARIDTGSNGALHLHAPFVNKEGLATDGRKLIALPALGVGGESSIFATKIKSFQIGSFKLEQIPGDLSTSAAGALGVSNAIVTVGAKILMRFTVWFDYARTRLILEPTADYTRPFEVDRAGLGLKITDNQIVVSQVVPGSPAAECGLLPGDVVFKINGQDANEIGLELARAHLRGEEGTKIKLRINRDGKNFKKKFKLQEYL